MSSKVISHNARLLGINLTFWLLITLISATQLYVRFQESYNGGWPNFVWRQGVVWVGWAILTPFIFYFVKRVNNDNRIKSGAVHLLYAIVFTGSYSIILSVLSTIFFNSETSVIEFLRQNLITGLAANLLVYLLIVSFGLLLVFYENAKKDKERQHELDMEVQSLEKQLVGAQLDTLKAQIQPHFLFNSLHSVASLIRKKELTLATETIATLSDLLRATLKNQDKNLVTLEDEMALLSKYLDVEKIRFGDKLSISMAIDSEAKASLVPAFILQPIIENCFKHAFHKTEQASIELKAYLSDSTLHLSVEDNGCGLIDGWESTSGSGIGIKNVQERLKTLYKNQGKFSLSQKNEGGTLAEFLIPNEQGRYE